MEDTERFAPSRYKHWVEDQVRFGDLDSLGHVNNNSIGQYFENARAHFFMKVTPNWPHCEQLFILAHFSIDFRRELHYPAKLKIGTGVAKLGRTSMTLVNALYRDAVGIAYCENVSVFIDQKTRTPIELPKELRSILEHYSAS